MVIKYLACLMLAASVAGTLLSCSLQRFNIFKDSDSGYMNPHIACARCHGVQKPQAGKPLFPFQDDPSEICLACHNYAENHHPVNFVPQIPIDPAYPLYRGKISCLTCHEIHGGPLHAGSSKLLRGGPFADRRGICFDCHGKEKFAEINPHNMLDKNGAVRNLNNKPVCLICHEVQPDPNLDTAGNVRFRADVGFLCWRCHPSMRGTFFEKHFLVRPSLATMQYMVRPDIREKFSLPLVPWGRINCSTCHNPHQAGVIVNQPAAAGAGTHLRLRAANLCEGCHNIY